MAFDQKPFVVEKEAEFKYAPGFSLSQAQKSVNSFHTVIKQNEGIHNILEVSTKSESELGIMLSAFNLKYKETQYYLENVFQSSKVFLLNGVKNGPYRELLDLTPYEAKKSPLLKNSGVLNCFMDMEGNEWALEPKTAYYDWIYIQSLDSYFYEHQNLERLLSYNAFTDIAFVPEKSFNCQARALAKYVGMQLAGEIDFYLSSRTAFLSSYDNGEAYYTNCEQITMF